MRGHISVEGVEGSIVCVMAKRAGLRNELPDSYFEGYLEKGSFKDEMQYSKPHNWTRGIHVDFDHNWSDCSSALCAINTRVQGLRDTNWQNWKSRRLYTCLCGSTLYFYNEKRDADYVEKVALCGFISITDDCSLDRNLDAARLNLKMKDGYIKLTAPSAESRELWKGFIHSVAELSVPPSLNLLPGQIHMLKEAVEKERERIKNLAPPGPANCSPYITLNANMPACYYKVSRLEAELLLEREADKGNMLLRPSGDGNSFSVSTRQDYGGSIFKHYRVSRKPTGGFILNLETPVFCATLQDVVTLLVAQTNGAMIPLHFENTYETTIEFVQSDNENGEKSLQKAQTHSVQPRLHPKPKDLQKVKRPAIVPPAPPPRKPTLPMSESFSTNTFHKTRVNVDTQKQTISELKQRFEKMMKPQK